MRGGYLLQVLIDGDVGHDVLLTASASTLKQGDDHVLTQWFMRSKTNKKTIIVGNLQGCSRYVVSCLGE